MTRDPERRERVRRALEAAGLDAVVCQLPENLVLLAGYWPVIGRSAVVFPTDGEPVVLAPVLDTDALNRATVDDVRTFPVWKMGDPSPEDSLERLLTDTLGQMGLRGKRIGFEAGFEDVSPTQKVLEPWVPGAAAQALIRRAAAGSQLVDAADILMQTRARKTPFEVARIRTACEIGDMGLAAFRAAVEAGKTEAQVAAEVEYAVMVGGAGYHDTIHARGQAFVFSGAERIHQFGWGLAPNTRRRLQPGDMVMVELSVVADGYYADLTRVRTVGPASEDQRHAYQACLEAQAAAMRAVHPGATGAEVDAAARTVLNRHGLGEAFIHLTGHGVGFRYHDGPPALLPNSTSTLAEGMVHSLEPGIYLPGLGGIRIEDDVAVTESGCDCLSHAGRGLD
ncbi:MAG: M24 family metallopeptidase [Bacillota bacterium]